ncbi:MAG: T9SS type A sorting domain-containing protein [Bacteroidales bacterium]
MNNALENNDASWIRDLWIGSFTGICGSALMWDNMHKRELWPHFGRLRAFVAGYDFDESNGDQKGWIPYHDFDEMHYENWQRKPGIVDLFYLRSPDKLNAVGVLANRTYNFYTQWNVAKCGAFVWESDSTRWQFELNTPPNIIQWDDQAYNSAKTAYNINEALQVDVKSKKRYIITYIDPNNLQVVHTQEKYNLTGKLRLDFPYLTGTTIRPILLVCVEPKNNKSLEQFSDSTRKYFEDISAEIQEKNSKVTALSRAMVSPNPTDQAVLITLPVSTENCRMILFSCSGMMIKSNVFSGQTFLLDVGDCDAGVYILQLNYNQKVETVKLIIQ